MVDFRDTEIFKAFSDCRLNRSFYEGAISSYRNKDSDLKIKKESAIKAMAHNEKCLKIATIIRKEINKEGLNKVGPLLKAYELRIGYENDILMGLYTDQPSPKANSALLLLESQIVAEQGEFTKLKAASLNPPNFISMFLWVLLIFIIFSSFRGHLSDSENQSATGTLKNSIKGIFIGLKDTVSSLRKKDG